MDWSVVELQKAVDMDAAADDNKETAAGETMSSKSNGDSVFQLLGSCDPNLISLSA